MRGRDSVTIALMWMNPRAFELSTPCSSRRPSDAVIAMPDRSIGTGARRDRRGDTVDGSAASIPTANGAMKMTS
jgi:hypothetical protein